MPIKFQQLSWFWVVGDNQSSITARTWRQHWGKPIWLVFLWMNARKVLKRNTESPHFWSISFALELSTAYQEGWEILVACCSSCEKRTTFTAAMFKLASMLAAPGFTMAYIRLFPVTLAGYIDEFLAVAIMSFLTASQTELRGAPLLCLGKVKHISDCTQAWITTTTAYIA